MKLEHFRSNFQRCKKIQKLKTLLLEKQLNLLECTASYFDNSQYITCKSKLDQLYNEKTNSVRIRSKCDWYEYGEKSTRFFLNLEKIWAQQNNIRNILKNGKENTDQKKSTK